VLLGVTLIRILTEGERRRLERAEHSGPRLEGPEKLILRRRCLTPLGHQAPEVDLRARAARGQ
jgi:hypothetical protein